MSRLGISSIVIALPLVLGACGNTTEDRAISGAGIGAGAGAIIGAVTPVGALGGALIGGAVGGTAGAVTDSSQVNLGKPIWRGDSSSANANPNAAYDPNTVRNIQGGLQRLGYDPGAADGRFGPKTEDAIRRYQQDNRLPVDGQPTSALWENIRSRING